MYLDSKATKRFLQKILIGDECWEWTAGKSRGGYGHFRVGGKIKRAPRVAYRHFKGPIPKGLHVCHTCDNPGCVNPKHLWLGDRFDNLGDASKKGKFAHRVHPNSLKTHCKRGHEFTRKNTYIRPSGNRQCRTCINQKKREYYRAKA